MTKDVVDTMSSIMMELLEIEDIKSVYYELEFEDGHKISQKVTKPEIPSSTGESK